jgi:nucleoside-diphosphate-sugar epimerase
MDALIAATQGVDSVIDVHGMRPLRFTKISDLFVHPKKDPLHPYNVNYVGVKKILAAMEINKVNKIVRITGSLVGKNAFIPFRVLFNVLLSMTGKWHEASEIEIRKSGLDYTILRPTGIHDEPAAGAQNRSLVLVHGESSEKVPVPAKISISDLSDLIILSLKDDRLNKCSAICSSRAGSGETSWIPLLSKVQLPVSRPVLPRYW